MFRVVVADRRRRFGVVLLLSIGAHVLLLVHLSARPPDRLPAGPILSVSLTFIEPAAPTKSVSRRPPTKATRSHVAPAATVTTPNDVADSTPVAPAEAPRASLDAARTDADSAAPTTQTLEQLRALVQLDLQHYFDHSYPPMAKLRGWEGTVSLGVTIQPDGTLDDVHVLQSSGYDMLDRSAVRTMKRIERLVEARPLLRGRSVELSLPVVYRLNN